MTGDARPPSADSLSPRQLAEAIGVSESSIKRWIDLGLLPASRTVGGHRRIEPAVALAFAREQGYRVHDPVALGAAASSGSPEELAAALHEGDVGRARDLCLRLWLELGSIARLADGPVRAAMARIGELWLRRADGIAVEHLSSTTCLQALSQLQDRIPPPAPDAPLALGGGVEGDPDLLPTLLGSMALQESGWRTLNLGPGTPIAAVRAAIGTARPRLVWMTVSHVAPSGALARELESLATDLAATGATLLVGGRRAGGLKLRGVAGLRRSASLVEATAFASGLRVTA